MKGMEFIIFITVPVGFFKSWGFLKIVLNRRILEAFFSPQSIILLNIFLTASPVYIDRGLCYSHDSQRCCFSDQRLKMALGHYENTEVMRNTAEQVCELRDGSSKNFFDDVL